MKKRYNSLPFLLLIAAICFFLGAFTHARVSQLDIDRNMVEQAAQVIGLEMTPAEIDTMLPDLTELREDYAEMRQYKIKNEISPALYFNPLPKNFQPLTQQKPLVFSELAEVRLPKNETDLAFYTVRQLSKLIHSKQISSVALTQYFLDRLEQFDPQLHCVISLTKERALAQARKMDDELARGQSRGELHGIPFGIKDLLNTKDYKTTWGATPFQNQQFDNDAVVLQKLEAAGGVLVAKLTLGALAWGDVWYGGQTRNPWAPESGSSGSSAGSASAVSAGLVPFAIGTETLGSIVSPSTVCGTTGLRPSFGRVSRTGAMALSWSMDKIGPLCRNAEDCALVFSAIHGGDPNDRSLIDAAFNYNAKQDIPSLKVAYLKSDFDRSYAFKQQDSIALDQLRAQGVQLTPVELPEMPPIGFILSAEAAAAFDELTRSNQDDELVRQIRFAWPNVFRQSRFIPAVEYIQANRLRSQLIEEMNALMEDYDVLIHPSWASQSLRISNLTGHPCVVLPNGFRDARPTSLTFTGKLFGEAEILRFAQFYQDHTDFHLKHPTLE
ncbi:MAG: amidase [Bacteroidota bacterium]